jgi:hypothetical protein
MKYIFLICWPVVSQVYHQIKIVRDFACEVPVISDLPICGPAMFITGASSAAEQYTAAMHTEFSGLEALLVNSAEVVPVAQGLTDMRLSVDDLILIVKSSTLTSRDALVDGLSFLSLDAKDTLREFHKFFAQVQTTIDTYVFVVTLPNRRLTIVYSVLILSNHLIYLLQHSPSPNSPASTYCRVLGNTIGADLCATSRDNIAKAFSLALHRIGTALRDLVVKAALLQVQLDRMEAHLDSIRDMVALEAQGLIGTKADIMADLLTSIGMHRKQIAKLDLQLRSLKQVTRYRAVAARSLLGAYNGLHEMEEGLEALRWIVVEGELIGEVPAEVLLNSLVSGAQRLAKDKGLGLDQRAISADQATDVGVTSSTL